MSKTNPSDIASDWATDQQDRAPAELRRAMACPASSTCFQASAISNLADRRRDLLLSKTLPSCFADTDLDRWLRENGIDTVAVTGYMTQNCDESTARDAAHRGYHVEFLSDATGTLRMSNEVGTINARELHEAVTIVLQSRFAAVVTTEQWCEAVASGVPLTGSNIFASTAAAREERLSAH